MSEAETACNAFTAFPEDAMVRISPTDIAKRGSLFFTIFQTFMSGTDADGEAAPYFSDYPPDFFDSGSSSRFGE
jgi:type I restriction enzyme R subunit